MSHHSPRELDRWAELANIGAGHAAGALAVLLGRTIRMQVPRLSEAPTRAPEPAAPEPDATGVLFRVEGGFGGSLAVLFPDSARASLLARLLGTPESESAPEQVESALGEAGNILASHALSALADTLAARVVPSVPQVERCATRRPGPLRIETPLVDAAGTLQGLLVWTPDPEPSV